MMIDIRDNADDDDGDEIWDCGKLLMIVVIMMIILMLWLDDVEE